MLGDGVSKKDQRETFPGGLAFVTSDEVLGRGEYAGEKRMEDGMGDGIVVAKKEW